MAVKVKFHRNAWWVFIDYKGKRKAKRVGSEKAANDAAAKIQARITLGQFNIEDEEEKRERERQEQERIAQEQERIQRERERFRFSAYYKGWLESYVKHNTKDTTYASYELAYRAHLLPCLGDRDIREITREQLEQFVYEKLNADLARNTVRGYLAPLREMFNHALAHSHVARNPCLGLMRQTRKERGERPGKISFLTREELALLLEACQRHFPAYYPFVLLLARTGLRLGEAVALQWQDLDFNGRFIEVRRNYTRGKVSTPKSGKGRRVDMSLHLTETLKALLVERKKETLRKGWGEVPAWVFTGETGTMMDPDNFRRRVWEKLLPKADLRHIRIHDLRHTFASLLIQQGESLAYVRDQMGHHSIQVTVDIYGHLVPGGNKAAVDRLDEPNTVPSVTIRNLSATGPERAPLAQVAGQADVKKPLISQGLR